MIKSILMLLRFNLNKSLNKKNAIILYLIILLYSIIKSQCVFIPGLNMTDIEVVIQMNSPFVIIVQAFFSIYIGSSLFIEKDLDYFIKSRIKCKRIWLISKIVSILVINIIISLITIAISFLFGVIIGGSGISWSDRVLNLPPEYPYAALYSPFKLLFINIVVFTLIMTLLSLISGLIYMKYNRVYLGISIILMYMLGSSALSFLGDGSVTKAIIFTNYIIFSRRNYYNTESELIYMTTKQSIIYPTVGLVILVIYFIIRIKSFEFKLGDKKYE